MHKKYRQRLHMDDPSVARQMDPPDNKQQTARGRKPLHLRWIRSITRTTLPSRPPQTPRGPAGRQSLSEQDLGFDTESTAEKHEARPR